MKVKFIFEKNKKQNNSIIGFLAGILKDVKIEDYKKHLEEKYLRDIKYLKHQKGNSNSRRNDRQTLTSPKHTQK